MEAAVISECALSCVRACFFVPVLIACVNVEAFWSFSANVPGSSFDGWPYLDISEALVCSYLKQKTHSIHAEWLYVCVSSRLLWTDSLFVRGHGKTVPLWFNYHSEYSWRGNKRLGDIMVWFTQVFWHRVEQRGLSALKRELTSLISPFRLFLLKVSKLSPHALSETAIPDVIPNPLCVRAHLCWIQFV